MRVREMRATTRRISGLAIDNAMGEVWRKEYAGWLYVLQYSSQVILTNVLIDNAL